MAAQQRDIDRVLDKLDEHGRQLSDLQSSNAVLVRATNDAAQSRQRIYAQTKELEQQSRAIESRVQNCEQGIEGVKYTCSKVDGRLAAVETWRDQLDSARDTAAGEKRVTRKVLTIIVSIVGGAALLIGGIAGNILVKILEGRGMI